MITHYMYVDILFPLTKAIPIMFERVPPFNKSDKHGSAKMQRNSISWTRYYHACYHPLCHTFSLSSTWLGQNATLYHNFNALQHVLSYIFSQFSMVWGEFATGTRRYCQIDKKKYVNTFLKRIDGNCTVTRCK